MTECEVKIRNLRVRRGRVEVKIKELCIERGTKVCIVGESGAGKTTLLDSIAGLLKYEGVIKRPKFFYLPFNVSIPPFQTVWDFIRQNAVVSKCIDLHTYVREAREYLKLLGIGNYSKKVVHMSDGERRRMLIALALSHNCDLLLIDEPFQGLDPQNVLKVSHYLREYKGTGIYVVHNYLGLNACDYVYILKNGELNPLPNPLVRKDGCYCYC